MRKVFHRVASVGDVPAGTGTMVNIGGGRDCALFHTEDDRYFATGSLCSHQNEPLDRARLEGCEVICRRHHLRFDLCSGNCTNAGGYGLRTYDVRVDGSEIYVGDWED